MSHTYLQAELEALTPKAAVALEPVDEVALAAAELAQHLETQAEAIAPEKPRRKQKTFQYAAHYREEHNYSPFHEKLDSALKHFYGKANLQTVLLKKGWLDFNNLYLLDHATVDVWPRVVWVKIPKWIPCQHLLILQKAEQYFCRFISKRDFLEAAIDYAMLQGHQAIAHRSALYPDKMEVCSTRTGLLYDLTPTQHQCECCCSAYKSLSAAFSEDAKMLALLIDHPMLCGQLPDKHVFSVWAAWGAKNFRHYQHSQGKRALGALELSLTYITPGHYNVYHRSRKLGTVDRRFNVNVSYWVNQRQVTALITELGDRVEYETAEEAAIALAQLLKVIGDGERAKADLFGGGYDPQPQHLIGGHGDFQRRGGAGAIAIASRSG